MTYKKNLLLGFIAIIFISSLVTAAIESPPTNSNEVKHVYITPSHTTTQKDTLTCVNGSVSTDVTSLSYKWFRNGVQITGATSQTLGPANFNITDNITCGITPNNGGDGSEVNSTTKWNIDTDFSNSSLTNITVSVGNASILSVLPRDRDNWTEATTNWTDCVGTFCVTATSTDSTVGSKSLNLSAAVGVDTFNLFWRYNTAGTWNLYGYRNITFYLKSVNPFMIYNISLQTSTGNRAEGILNVVPTSTWTQYNLTLDFTDTSLWSIIGNFDVTSVDQIIIQAQNASTAYVLLDGFYLASDGSKYGEAVSRSFDLGSNPNITQIQWSYTNNTPSENVTLRIRTSSDNATWSGWLGPDNTANTLYTEANGSAYNNSQQRFVQYKAYFNSNDSTSSATLNDVEIIQSGYNNTIRQYNFNLLFNGTDTLKLYDDPISIDVNNATYGSTMRIWVMVDSEVYLRDKDCSFDTTLGTKSAINNGNGSYVYYFDHHNLNGATQVNFTSFNCTDQNNLRYNISFFFQENYTTYNTTFSDFNNVGLIWDNMSGSLSGGYTNFFGFFNITSIGVDMINISDSSVNLATLLPNYTTLIFSDAYSYKQMSAEQKNAVDENIRRGMDVWFGRINESDIVVNGNLSTLCGISSSLYGSGTKNHYLDAKFIPFGEMGNFSATTGRLFTINESAGSFGIVKVINNTVAFDTIVLNNYGNGTVVCEGYIFGGVSSNIDNAFAAPKAMIGFMNHVFLKHYGRSALFKGPRYVSFHYDNPSNATSAPNAARKSVIASLWRNFSIQTTFATIANPFNGSIAGKDAFYWYVINNSANISLIPHGWLYDNDLHYNTNCESGDCPCDAGEFWGSNTTSGGRCLYTNDSYANISRNIVSVFSSVNMPRQGKYVVCGNHLICSNAAVQMTQNGVIGGYCPIMKSYDGFNSSYDAAYQTRTITEGYTSLSWMTRRAEDNYWASLTRFSNDDAGAYDVQKMQYYFMVGNLLTVFGHQEDYDDTNDLAFVALNLTYRYLNRSTEPFCFLPGADLLDYGLSVRAANINYNCSNLQGINVTGRNIQIQHVQWIIPHKNGKPWYAYTDTYANYSNTTGNQPTTIYGAGTFTFNFTENKTQMYDVVHVNYVDNGVDVKDVTWSNVTKQLNVNISGSGSNKRISFRIPQGVFTTWYLFVDGDLNVTSSATGVYNFTIGTMSEHNMTLGTDITKPSVTSIFSGNYNISSEINITVNVTDNVRADKVIINITYPNGYVAQYNMTNNTKDVYNLTFINTTALGQYNITIITNDTSNNVNDTERSNFTIVDATKPSVTNITANNVIVSVTVNITANVTDNIAADRVTANITKPDGTISQVVLVNETPDIYNGTFSSTSTAGTYTIRIVANDTSGNINASETKLFNATQITTSTTEPETNITISGGQSFNVDISSDNSVSLQVGDIIRFTSGDFEHSLIVVFSGSDEGRKYVDIYVSRTLTVTVFENTSKDIDIDGDGETDITISVGEIEGNKVKISVAGKKLAEEPADVEEPPPVTEETPITTPDQAKPEEELSVNPIISAALIVIVIIALVFSYFYLAKRKHKRKK